MWKSIADTHIDIAYKKYRWYLCQYSKSIADTTDTNTNTVILTTLAIKGFDLHISVGMSSITAWCSSKLSTKLVRYKFWYESN